MMTRSATTLDLTNSDSEQFFSHNLEKLHTRLHSANPMMSEDAALRLAQMGFPAVNVLSVALMSHSVHVAVNAARAIGIIGNDAKSAVFNLVWMLQHPDRERRETAAAALGRLKTNPVVSVQALARALSDSETTVRQYASAALGEFDADELIHVTKELAKAAEDDDTNVQVFAKFALLKAENKD